MAKTTAAGAAAKTVRAKAAGAVKAPAKAAPAKTAVKTAAKTVKAAPAPARKPAAKPAAAVKLAAAKRAATPAAKAAKAAAKAIAKPAASKPTSKPASKPVVKTRTARTLEAIRPDAAAQARPTLVRDSFTMPEQEYAVLGAVKQACLKAGFEVKKSELLRIGVALLGQLDAASLRAVLGSLPQLKTGRPPGE
jgi:hypothetical protein